MNIWKDMSGKEKIVTALIKLPIIFYLIFNLKLNWIQLLLLGLPIVLIINLLVFKISRSFFNLK
ncbi:hypothetical protein RBU61_00525 [Tissierella sp. MB52-C2]|uniref:hypothetical protein n=1 Tax=Tissierella sp. MB52-C2 TaxID=3070999 RepID=UPI00280A793D|nr:hypothetical protein [Tissierella sp. MB52-C2]WMM25175.1 hypothetical protein RBU61_00525 [Tissierella sp. MB52-C2]